MWTSLLIRRGRPAAGLILVSLLFVTALPGCDLLTAPEEVLESVGQSAVRGPSPAAPVPDEDGCIQGTQSSGAHYEICTPSATFPEFTGTLVIYARGFIFPQVPLMLPARTLDGVDLFTEFLGPQGFAYATTSFYTNGLVDANRGVKDLRELITLFTRFYERPDRVLLLGFSNGAYLSTIALEKNPGLFDGALASCGPIGGFKEQLYSIGDVFMTFWAYFGDLVEQEFGTQVLMPDGSINPAVPLIDQGFLESLVRGLLASNLDLAGAVAGALQAHPHVILPAEVTLEQFAEIILINAAYYVFATNDAIAKLRGQPYTTIGRFPPWVPVPTIRADRNAEAQLEARFDPKGNIRAPLIALHNTFDPLVPYWHNDLYTSKVRRPGLFTPVPVDRFGHCAFHPDEVAAAFGQLEMMTHAPALAHR